MTEKFAIGAMKPVDLEVVYPELKDAWKDWAEETIRAFYEMDCEAVEIEKWPDGKGIRGIANLLRKAKSKMGPMGVSIDVKQTSQHLYLAKKTTKECSIINAPAPAKKRIPMPQSSAGLKKAKEAK